MALLLLVGSAAVAAAAAPPAVRFFPAPGGGYGVALAAESGWSQPAPLQIEVVAMGAGGAAQWVRAAYSATSGAAGQQQASGTVRTPGGSELHVLDTFAAAGSGGFVVQRTVTVAEAGEGEAAFSSRFSLASQDPATLREREFFMPGVWYLNSQAVTPPHALAGDLDASAVLLREDRLPLPMILSRVSCHDIAAIWVAFFSRWQRYCC